MKDCIDDKVRKEVKERERGNERPGKEEERQ